MSTYTHRVTIACPESMMSDGNQLAACMGLSLADLNTFDGAHYQDEQGNRYAVCSAATTPRVLQAAAGNTIQRPAFDTGNDINLTGANRALDALVIGAVLVVPDKITAVVDIDGQQAIAIMGLTSIPNEEV